VGTYGRSNAAPTLDQPPGPDDQGHPHQSDNERHHEPSGRQRLLAKIDHIEVGVFDGGAVIEEQRSHTQSEKEKDDARYGEETLPRTIHDGITMKGTPNDPSSAASPQGAVRCNEMLGPLATSHRLRHGVDQLLLGVN